MNTMDAKAQAALSFLFSELTYVEQEVLRQPYPEIKYPRILPVDTSAPDYIEAIAFKTLDFSGRPQRLGDRSQDIPLVDVGSSKGSVSVETYAQGYDYTLIEVGKAMEMAQQSRSAAINLLAEKASAARQTTEQFLNEMFFIGDQVGNGFDLNSGLLNDDDVPTYTSGEFLPGGTDKTIDEILDGSDPDAVANELLQLFNQAVEQVRVTQTNTIYRPTHILLPPLQLGKMRTYRIPNTAETLISYLERVINITFDELIHLQGQGASGGDRMMVYTRDEKFVKAHMPMPFQLQAPATRDNVVFQSAGIVRVAGTELRIPKQHAYVDGV
mgnify:CR=1 FL=1